VKNESVNSVYLDQKGYIFQNRFLYDYTFSGDEFQLFAELNTEFNFGDKEDSFANNSLVLAPSIFLSYFPRQPKMLQVLTFQTKWRPISSLSNLFIPTKT
jgi:hypothetical protein